MTFPDSHLAASGRRVTVRTVAALQAIQIPAAVLDYLNAHHIITIGTASFTGMPHAATIGYASDPGGIYFSMRPEELTVRNIDANHWASFTIDDYTPDFRKVRELRGVGRCSHVADGAADSLGPLFASKSMLPPPIGSPPFCITPLELHFVDFEYESDVAPPLESSIVYEAASLDSDSDAPVAPQPELARLEYPPGAVIVRQGEPSDGFFMLVEGEVELRREGHGADVVVTRLQAGQLFGELTAFTGQRRDATVTAVGRVVVVAIDRSAMQEFAGRSAVADLGERLRQNRAQYDR